jgi:6-pyruvoyltetrahydropterin/6-carboxytetrahydropterin synthase
MLEITKSFAFEAAHFQPNAPAGHPNARLHGHSFMAEVTLAGAPDPVHGMIRNLDDVEAALREVREALDHRLLNDIAGLEKPTMESLTVWIFARLKPTLPEIVAVTIRRPSLGQSCTYRSA